MKILFLSQWFDPEPFFKGLLFAKELVGRGHEVEILTGFPNYPGGKVYEGYCVKPYQREVMDGIVVHRVFLFPSHDKNAVRRVANYASFALSSALMGPWLVKKPDVIYAYHAPATIGFPAAVLKARFGVPLVYDINDMWPDTLNATGMLTNSLLISIIGEYCKLIYRLSDAIVVVTPGFKKLLLERGVPESKIKVIYNWAFEYGDSFKPVPVVANQIDFAGRFNVLFAGTMGTAQDLGSVLDAAKLVLLRSSEVQFVFVGGGVDRRKLEERVNNEQISNVWFLPRQEPSAMGAIYAAADVLLVHLKDDSLFRITIPSKTTAYMAAGKPVLMGVRGDAAALIETAKCGFVFPPQDSEALAEMILRLANLPKIERDKLGENGRKYYYDSIGLSAGCTAFVEVFESALMRKRLCDNGNMGGDSIYCCPATKPRSSLHSTLKRGVDISSALALLVTAAPLLAGTAVAIRTVMGSPVLFRQTRPGKNGKPFELLKFRTMSVPKAGEQEASTDSARLTPLGKLLRKTSIDELPTLINVLKGDMSLVGPRPLLMRYLERYTSEQARRHETKPGITGWAQVNGRNSLSWEEKFKHDVWYVDNQTVALDIKILLKTVLKVLKREGISATGEATMPEFLGAKAGEN